MLQDNNAVHIPITLYNIIYLLITKKILFLFEYYLAINENRM